MPSVEKYAGPTSLYREFMSVSGVGVMPSIETSLPQLLPPMKATSESLTPITPGSAASSSSSRAKKSALRGFA